MTEPRPPGHHEPADDGELLAAYLAADLDEASARRLEHRLAAEPELSARLEQLHDLLVELRGVDDVEPPPGHRERLDARLAAELDAPALETARARRAGPPARRRRTAWSLAAAGLVALAIAGAALLGGWPPGGEDLAGPERRSAGDAAEEAAPGGDSLDDAGGGSAADAGDGGEASGASGAETEQAAPAPDEPRHLGRGPFNPQLLDEQAVLEPDVESAARARYTDLPEVEQLLGMPRSEAEELAPSHWETVARAEPFASGPLPGACLDEAGGSLDAEVVTIARVETVTVGGEPGLAYVFVVADAGDRALEEALVRIVAADSCTQRAALTL